MDSGAASGGGTGRPARWAEPLESDDACIALHTPKALAHVKLRLPNLEASIRIFMNPTRTSTPLPRCPWATTPLGIRYHDREWGVAQHDDRVLFEFLILEGAQAGLSWNTILEKRDNYRRVFDHFDARKVARYDAHKVQTLLADAGIVRNRLKIAAAIRNANAFLAVQKEFGSFDAYIWRFVAGRPVRNVWKTLKQIPARTPQSDAMSKDLLARGFKFVGPTICYAFMQAVGMVNDHLVDCFRYSKID